ncbi:MAG TPA: FAD-dependent oxidoreductase [Anaerolineaceae bacterium]|nr:MAG: pyridine nucleotide-disulfide oxidoreductase [Chloroflexi bacterium GWB2_54_36]HAL16626.1 FAD-dependent oxidoreductase [Anaerolineaceae bacterium]
MTPKTSKQNLKHVVIVGGGFGGLRAARRLAKAPVCITLIDRNNYHLFQPLLYQVATAGVSPTDVAYPLRSIFRRQKNLVYQMAEVTRVDLNNRRLETTNGSLDYDYLILAVGGETNYFGLESVAVNAFGLKGLEDASPIRDHLLHLFERAALVNDPLIRQALLTFVVVGGGPTGVEMAGAISELIRLVLTKDFPNQDFSHSRVLLLEATDRLLAAMPAGLGQATQKALKKKGVEVRFGAAVGSFDGRTVNLSGGEAISTHTLIWAAGVRSAALVDTLGLPQAAQRRVRVEPTLQLPGHPEVYVIGDAAYLEDENKAPLPMVAPVAMQQGEHAADNLVQALNEQPQISFHYHDPGTMATIGRNQAVAWIGPLQLHGFLAWVTWLVVHIFQLIGFRNRLLVLINWAWDYFFYDRAVRLISPTEPTFSPQKIEQGQF